VEAFPVADRQPNPDKVAWSVKSWCADVDLSPAYVYELIAARRIDGVKVDGKRLITTAPKDFIARLGDRAA
jgi:hypothetical protein